MKISTTIYITADFSIKVCTNKSVTNSEYFWTNLSIIKKSGENIILISKYSKSEKDAIYIHQMLSYKANNLFK